MSKLLAMMKSKNYMYATIKGSLTENNGVFSGFGDSNYLTLQQPFILNANTVAEIVFKINFNDDNGTVYLGHPNTYGIQMTKGTADNKIHFYLGNNSSWSLISNATGPTVLSSLTDYYIKVTFNKGNVQVLLSTDKINWTTEINRNINLTVEYSYIIDFGKGRSSGQHLNGSIDLNQSYIKIANTKYQLQAVVGYRVIGTPTITDGVVSGFSSANYLRLDNLNIGTKDFEIATSFISNNVVNNRFFASYGSGSVFTGLNISSSGAIRFYVYDGTNQYYVTFETYQSNTKYYIKGYRKGTEIGIKVSTNNINWTTITNAIPENANIQLVNGFMFIGANTYSGTAFDGSIDLKETYIKIDGKLWFNGQQA